MTTLSAEQRAGIEKIQNWYADKNFHDAHVGGAPVFRLFGPAGTGKTTMAKEIPQALGLANVRYGTYTGKAAHVLRGKGASPVSTIHSAIYFPTSDKEATERLAAAREEMVQTLMDQASNARTISKARDAGAPKPIMSELEERRAELADAIAELQSGIAELEAATRRMAWEWNSTSEWASAELIILDEVSMVGPKLAGDIEAYGVPVLVLGDPAQLPPVEGGGYYTEAKPDHLLETVIRQALESPVLELATRIRTSRTMGLGLTPDDVSPASLGEAMEHDQVLCWSNRRRWALIKAMRSKMGRPGGQVVRGDRIMCLTNNKDLAVFNGQQFDVVGVRGEGTLGPTLELKDDEGHVRVLATFADGFAGQEMQDQAKKSGAGWKGQRMLATFANAITVHKAQGSEWKSVYVVNEVPNMIRSIAPREGHSCAVEQARRWLYTAVSRASDTVTVTRAER